MGKQRIVLSIAAIIGMVATFLPWATVLGQSVSGTAGDGWITLGIFAIPLIISIIGKRAEPLGKAKFACVVAGAINAIIGIVKITDINSTAGRMLGSFVSFGFGLYLLIIAGVCVCVASFLKLK